MNRMGMRELCRRASAILHGAAAGETVEVTDRGRPVAILLKTMPAGLLKLEREGLISRADGDLLRVAPIGIPPGAQLPSKRVSEGRAEGPPG